MKRRSSKKLIIFIIVMNFIKHNNYDFIQHIFLNNVPEEIEGYRQVIKKLEGGIIIIK
jgi:hypothetical protein